MSNPNDLTRWNRAGLGRFRYLDGNAVTYLDQLREALASRFPAWRAMQGKGDRPVPGGLSGERAQLQRQQRMVDQYHGDRGDWAWEIARSFSRACHLLTETIDAYANEGYLGTATQWENVQQLVEMIGYHPAPPASASTPLVLEAKPEQRGLLRRGFQVSHTPKDGRPRIVFETLADVEVDARLNGLRLKAFDRNPDDLVYQGAGTNQLVLQKEIRGLTVGQPLVIEGRPGDAGPIRSSAHAISSVSVAEHTTALTVWPAIARGRFAKGYTEVHLKPTVCLAPRGPGPEVRREVKSPLKLTEGPGNLKTGGVAVIEDGEQIHYRQLEAVAERDVFWGAIKEPNIQELTLRLDRTWISAAIILSTNDELQDWTKSRIFIPGDHTALYRKIVAATPAPAGVMDPIPLDEYLVENSVYLPPSGSATPSAREGHTGLTLARPTTAVGGMGECPQTVFVPPERPEWRADPYLDFAGSGSAVIETPLPSTIIDQDFAVLSSPRHLSWGRLSEVDVSSIPDGAVLRADCQHYGSGRFYLSETTVYTKFEKTARLIDWGRNTTPVAGCRLNLGPDPDGSLLRENQRIAVEQLDSDVGGSAFLATIERIERNDDVSILLDRSLESDRFNHHNTVIRGNVVQAGHGETKFKQLLGSGQATASNQRFVLRASGVSFVADPSLPHGVAAAVRVLVEEAEWIQVGTLADSEPTDPHFTVRLREDGSLMFTFGDGRCGRRLPTGTNNVRVEYRVGSGPDGNLKAGCFIEPAKPNSLIAAVRQPQAAVGGSEMEGPDSIRRSAPASLRTLGRAVSLEDFSQLAASHTNVWQARATARPVAAMAPNGQQRKKGVEVVVVPAHGNALDEALKTSLQAYLLHHALPSVELTLVAYSPKYLHLAVTVQVNHAQFDPVQVIGQVRTALEKTFSLRERSLGQPAYLSEVFRVVENVVGVANSKCVFLSVGDGNSWHEDPRQRIGATGNEVLFLDLAETGRSRLDLATERYEL